MSADKKKPTSNVYDLPSRSNQLFDWEKEEAEKQIDRILSEAVTQSLDPEPRPTVCLDEESPSDFEQGSYLGFAQTLAEANKARRKEVLRKKVALVSLGLAGLLGLAYCVHESRDYTLDREPRAEDICTIDDARRDYSLLDFADRYAEGHEEIYMASYRIRNVLNNNEAGDDRVAICYNPDYPGSHNKIMTKEAVYRNLPADQIVRPDVYPGITSID